MAYLASLHLCRAIAKTARASLLGFCRHDIEGSPEEVCWNGDSRQGSMGAVPTVSLAGTCVCEGLPRNGRKLARTASIHTFDLRCARFLAHHPIDTALPRTHSVERVPLGLDRHVPIRAMGAGGLDRQSLP